MDQDKILFVDDDAHLLASFERTYRKRFSFDCVLGPEHALEKVRTSGPYAVVVADMNMPGMNGVELLTRIEALAPETVRMMLTGNADRATPVEAVNRGHVFLFLDKPCPQEILGSAIDAGLRQYRLIQAERELLEETLTGSVKALTDVLALVSPEALGLGQRLRDSMRRFAQSVESVTTWELDIASLLACIGYASVPQSVLTKIAAGDPLGLHEEAIIARTPQVGHDLLVGIPRLAGAAKIVLYQNKQFDGRGFPEDAAAGEQIPPGARMLKILRDRMELEADGVVKRAAHNAMKSREGWYDPVLLDRCFECLDEFLENPISSEQPVLSLAVAQLLPGQIVVSDIVGRSGLKIVGAGARLTEMMIERLQNFAQLGEVPEPVLVQKPEATGKGSPSIPA
jgi:response regulator RpfG family c-di-GMP phosphodiesterase